MSLSLPASLAVATAVVWVGSRGLVASSARLARHYGLPPMVPGGMNPA